MIDVSILTIQTSLHYHFCCRINSSIFWKLTSFSGTFWPKCLFSKRIFVWRIALPQMIEETFWHFDKLIKLTYSFLQTPLLFFFFLGGVRAGMEDIKCALSIIAHQFTWSAKGLNKFIIMVEKTWLYYVSHQEEKQSWFFSLEDEVF